MNVAYMMMHGERLKGGRFVAGKNVRRDATDPAVWRDAPLPRVIRTDGWVPKSTNMLSGAPGKRVVWFTKGSILGYAVCDAGKMPDMSCEVSALGILDGEPVHVCDLGYGTVRVMVKGSRAVYASYDTVGTMTFRGRMPRLPWLHFVRKGERNISSGAVEVALSGKSDPRGSTLAADDAAAVSRAAISAYARLKSHANGMGMFLQPVIARYRLLDGAGATIVVSPPVMIGASDGAQCRGEFQLVSTDSLATLSAGSIAGKSFGIAVEGMEEIVAPWSGIVRRLVVEVCPETEVVDMDAECMTRVSNDGRDVTVHVTLPTGTEESLRRKVFGVLASEDKFEEHLVVEDPFGAGCDRQVDIPAYPAAKRITEVYVPGAHPLRDAVMYGFVGEAGGWTVACGESRELFEGYPAECFATDTASGGWRALVEVDVARSDGSMRRFVSACSGEGNAPAELSPLLMFPDINARKMTVSIETGGVVTSETYRLRPVTGVACACYLNDGCKGMMPRGAADELPAHGGGVTGIVERHGYAGIFADATLGHELDSMVMDGGTLVAAYPAPRGGGSWDFSRVRMLLFGSAGTWVATIDGKGKFHSFAPMDGRPVAGEGAICRASGAKGLTHYVAAGEDVIEVTRSGVSTLLTHCCADSVGWCGRRNELWLSGGEKPLRRVNPRWPEEVIEVGVPAAGLCQWNGRQLIVEEEGYVRDVSAEEDGEVDAAIALRYERPDGWSGGLMVDFNAAQYDGTIGVYGDNGSELPELLCSYAIKGALNAPAFVRLAAPGRRFVEMHMAGKGGGMILRN